MCGVENTINVVEYVLEKNQRGMYEESDASRLYVSERNSWPFVGFL